MIPSKIHVCNQIPITKNGKINISSIKEKFSSNIFKIESSVDSSNDDIRTKLFSLWKKILKIDLCDFDTNFFDAGGDSFSLLGLHNALCEELSENIEVVDLFLYTTINKQSEFISSLLDARRN